MSSSRMQRLPSALTAVAALVALWLVLAGGEPASWVVGGPTIAFALGLLLALPPAKVGTFRAAALVRLVAVFAVQTLRGAVDIGARSLASEPIPRPGIVRWRTRLASPVARLVLVHAISLVPGTLTARLTGNELFIHVLDAEAPWREDVAALERRIHAALEPRQATS